MEEYQIWTLFNSARVADAAVGIVSILAIWLALRVANLTRANPETDTIAKIVSTLFCGLIVLGSWQAWTIAAVNWTGTAGALSRLDNPSDFAKGFIDYSLKLYRDIGDQIGISKCYLITAKIALLQNQVNIATSRRKC